MSSAVETAPRSGPSTSRFHEEQIDDLRRRIAATRWPSKELVPDRSQGAQLATVRSHPMSDHDQHSRDGRGRDRACCGPSPIAWRRRRRSAGRRPPAVLRRRDRLAQLGAADAGGPARPRRPRRLLDLHLHQLAAHAALSSAPGPRSTRDAGLTVIGVHTPEFGFERDVDNVVARSRDFGVEYPIAIDSDYGVWHAFANHFWPARLHRRRRGPHPVPPLRRGRVRDDRDGHPAAAARGRRGRLRSGSRDGRARRASRSRPTGGRCERPRRTWAYGQSAGFASPDRAAVQRAARLSRAAAARPQPVGAVRDVDARPARRGRGRGRWPHRVPVPGARRQPRDGPDARGDSVPFRVLLDGEAPGAAHGFDVDEAGNGTLADQRLYQLIRQPGPSTSAASRSSSSAPAPRRTASPSAEVGARTRKDADVYKCGR